MRKYEFDQSECTVYVLSQFRVFKCGCTVDVFYEAPLKFRAFVHLSQSITDIAPFIHFSIKGIQGFIMEILNDKQPILSNLIKGYF